jgi:hypothetical protein
MAAFREIDHMFGHFEYKKTGAEISRHAGAIVDRLKKKIKERQQRIADIRKSYNITDADLVELYRMQKQNAGAINYTISSSLSNYPMGINHSNKVVRRGSTKIGHETEARVIPAGVVSNLETENSAINNETSQCDRLLLIIRNIEPRKKFRLSIDELEYLEF